MDRHRKKKLKKIKDPKRSIASRKKHTRELLYGFYGVERTALLYELVLDDKLDDVVRAMLVYDVEQIASYESVRVLRTIVHDTRQSDELRVRALYSLALLSDPLFDVDAMSVLANVSDTPAIRAEAAEKIGGLHIQGARAVLEQTLLRTDEDPRVLFWCLYACHTFKPDKALKAIVKRYAKDDREVDIDVKNIQKSKATLAMEATWVLECWRGLDTEPRWVLPA